MDSTFGKSFLFLTKLAWNCKVTLPVLVTAVFLAMDFRMQIELNIETEQLVFQVQRFQICPRSKKIFLFKFIASFFQDDIDDSDEYETVEESDNESDDDDDDDDDNDIE